MDEAQATYPLPVILLNRNWARSDLLGRKGLLDRLWEKVEVGESQECWPFTGCLVHGYGRIGLGGAEAGSAYAHRVVAEAYLGRPRDDQPQIRHLCRNRACCNPEHLAWGDQVANEADKLRHGVSNRGSRHGMAKLTEEQVRGIKRRLGWGETQRSLAERYGIAQQSVSEIATGRTWGWLEGGDV